jgi:hypothetical protein
MKIDVFEDMHARCAAAEREVDTAERHSVKCGGFGRRGFMPWGAMPRNVVHVFNWLSCFDAAMVPMSR